MKLSIVIPAHNEEKNIGQCLQELCAVISGKQRIPYEIIVVNDNSQDATEEVVRQAMKESSSIRIVNRSPPSGFGLAVRSGLQAVEGDVVVIYMADLSDDPEDVLLYYQKIMEGYDCVFGSRFTKGSTVERYPWLKLIVNRIANRCIQLMFWTRCNDLTNAFKAYRTSVIRSCGPFKSCHFNITLEMSLGALVRRYEVAQVPIRWYGRTWGTSNLKLREMGRRYLCTLLMLFFQRRLISDDLVAERLAGGLSQEKHVSDVEARVRKLETEIADLRNEVRAMELQCER